MSRSGSETRKRPCVLKARFTDEEAALVKEQAARAGLSTAALIRFAVLDQSPPRAMRTPAVSAQEIAKLLAKLGTLATALRGVEQSAAQALDPALIDAMARDLADLRIACFDALGRQS